MYKSSSQMAKQSLLRGVLGVLSLVLQHVFGEKVCATCDSFAKLSLKHFRGRRSNFTKLIIPEFFP